MREGDGDAPRTIIGRVRECGRSSVQQQRA
jgi:hypothetical protein